MVPPVSSCFSLLDLSGDDVILPKSVSWAEHNEERIIENREMMANLQKFKHKIGKIILSFHLANISIFVTKVLSPKLKVIRCHS